MSIMTIVRGIPGSGKSTYAGSLARAIGCLHLEADMFFIIDGEYNFDPAKIVAAHGWCTASAQAAVDAGIDLVISNTFVKHWEFAKYLEMAKSAGYDINIVALKTSYGSVHGVPTEVLERMKSSWEEYEGEIVID